MKLCLQLSNIFFIEFSENCNLLNPEVIKLLVLFKQPKDNQFTVTSEKEKLQIRIFEELELDIV